MSLTPEGDRRVAVIDLRNGTGRAELDGIGRIVADTLRRAIARRELYDIEDAEFVTSIRRRAAATGGRVAGVLVSGVVLRRRDSLVFQVHLADLHQGQVFRVLESRSAPVSDPSSTLAQLTTRTLAALDALQWRKPGNPRPPLLPAVPVPIPPR